MGVYIMGVHLTGVWHGHGSYIYVFHGRASYGRASYGRASYRRVSYRRVFYGRRYYRRGTLIFEI
jgi:hypothetical protein